MIQAGKADPEAGKESRKTNSRGAAKALVIDRKTLYTKMKAYGLISPETGEK